MWLTIAKYALQVAVVAVGQISPAQWASLGTMLQQWIAALQAKLPAGHPLLVTLSAYRAPASKLQAPKPDAEKWGS